MPTNDYAVVDPDAVENPYAGSDVPGEFRSLTGALGSEQLAVTLIRVPPHSDRAAGGDRRPQSAASSSRAIPATGMPTQSGRLFSS